jgi:hypothetical protein
VDTIDRAVLGPASAAAKVIRLPPVIAPYLCGALQVSEPVIGHLIDIRTASNAAFTSRTFFPDQLNSKFRHDNLLSGLILFPAPVLSPYLKDVLTALRN